MTEHHSDFDSVYLQSLFNKETIKENKTYLKMCLISETY